jgi:hypothetical protein
MTADVGSGTDGVVRPVVDLKRGDHVRLRDGRWGLLLGAPVLDVLRKGYVTASVSIEMLHTEGVTWLAGAKAPSRTPGEQLRHVETVFASMRPKRRRGGAR